MAKRPGGPMASRPLHFIWIVDSSGSMSLDGRMQSLNTAIKDSLPHMRSVARGNPYANVLVRCVKFSHGAQWHVQQPTPLEDFVWSDLTADPLEQATMNTDIIFLMDNSGSMGGEIRAIKESCLAFTNKIIEQEKSANVRLGLIAFAIGGHRYQGKIKNYTVEDLSTYTIGVWPLATPKAFGRNIESLKLRRFGGRGCYLANEDTVDIFPQVIHAFDDHTNSARMLVIVSDEIGDTLGLDEIVSLLKDASITAHVVGVSGESGAHELLAERTGGHFWNIKTSQGRQDFSALLDTVATTIAQEVKKRLKDGRESRGTDMGRGLELVAQALKIPPMEKRALPPVLTLISDGKPTDDFQAGLKQLMSTPWGEKAVRLAIAIGMDADEGILQDFIGDPEIYPLKANNPEALADYIRWISTVVLKTSSVPVTQMGAKQTSILVPQMAALTTESDGLADWRAEDFG